MSAVSMAVFLIGTTVAMVWMSVRLGRAERQLRELKSSEARSRAEALAQAWDEGFFAGLSEAVRVLSGSRNPESDGDEGPVVPEETRSAAGGAS